MKNRHNNGAHLHRNFTKKCEIIVFMRILAHSMCFKGGRGDMFWAPAYGPLRMMKHHVRLVIFIRDLRMKIVIAFLFSVDMTI